jgi:transcriptional regulator with XRE-family HTH domain
VAERSAADIALGRAVRELRQARRLSQEELGNLSDGMDRTYVGGIERGEKNPTYESLRRLCQGLGVRSSELLARAELLERGG